MIDPDPFARLQHHALSWDVSISDTFETETSLIAFCNRDRQDLVLKLIKRPGDEWCSGEVLAAFKGNGFVRVYEHVPGAILMERLLPGKALVDLVKNSADEEATDILVDVIQRMASLSPVLEGVPTVQDWGKGFARYRANGDKQVPKELVDEAEGVYAALCASQRNVRLLHGDLQHYNVLFDSQRGWLAIDPKGVIGELEYELGAGLRNPDEMPELFLARGTIERRLSQLTSKLDLDHERALAWAFAEAVLSAIWSVEDGFAVDATCRSLRLANAIRPMVHHF